MSEKQFNLSVVYDNFKDSLTEDEDITIKEYLTSYKELNKFFTLMGSMFSFVSQDLQLKIDILTEFLEKEDGNFISVRKMIDHENGNDLLNKKHYVSGSRTLLRLHRGLDFIRLFLRMLSTLEGPEHTGPVCREAYEKTLAKHHSFMIVTGAKLAMYTLPTKDDLFKRVCDNDDEFMKNALEILPKSLDIMNAVYDRVENMYTEYNLHSLP